MLPHSVLKMYADHFHPEKIIAAGPSAKVYRGVETATGRKVLIKVLLQDHETLHPLDREKLQLLAPTLLQVRHPQIAGLITLLPTEDEFALVYEFMPGVNARAFAAERQPAPADVRALAVQFMHALLVGEHLQQPHGDPKPSNLIIADHPGGGLFLQVQDWGLSLTRTSHPPETMWFRAPELHAGGRPTTQSDLFTAAASLFCIATNSAPAQGETVEEIMSDWHDFTTNQVLNHVRPDLDQPLRDWLAWLLNLEPQRRPHSVAQALDALMLSMQSGFSYMPQQAPAMAPGTQTTQLVSTSHPNAPKPKPITPKSAPSAAPATAAPAVAAKKSSGSRTLIAVVLNLVAIAIAGIFLWPFLRDAIAGTKITVDEEEVGKPAAKAKSAAPITTGSSALGRYIRVEIPGKGIINLAEVQVFSGNTNIAPKGTATQSSTDWGGIPELAIDGSTDGDNSKGGKVNHTDGQARSSPWWELDLGLEAPLETIVIWNRTDKDFGERTKNLTVKVLDAQKKVLWEKKNLPKPDPSLELVVGK
ncbi:protein kinase [Prosthecobacter sp.]|uniref:protein kinase domain-containing protein n=1 Tax=Prosthecobacter sp. TaxID=1965333 RepID=UPI002ABB4208|nr:protein kinase [Prosthecobacter sp.]MDZ4401460.1 protein kinase [Prosthecobacter sp.]